MDNFDFVIKNISTIVNDILIIISILLALISIFFKIKSNFTSCIVKFIGDAEADTELSNTEKMDMVVSWIKDSIPRMFKILFSDKVLAMMAENIYQDMKKYRETYITNKTGMTTSQVIQIAKIAKKSNSED